MKYFINSILFLLCATTINQAQPEDTNARKIFEEVEQRRTSITYEQSEMQMIIYNSSGQTRERTLQSYSYNQDDVSKSLLIFKEPANVRGTGFLNISEGSNEAQKLYLPALGRIQTISAAQKSDRFMGSDFTYEDLGDQNPEDYKFDLQAETDSAYVLRAAKKNDSQYHYLRFFVDPKRYTLSRVEYYNNNGTMIKKLIAENFKQINDKLWQPTLMTMYDLENDRRTELRWINRQIGPDIPQWRFTERGLRRGL